MDSAGIESDALDPADIDWTDRTFYFVYQNTEAGIPQAVDELARREALGNLEPIDN